MHRRYRNFAGLIVSAVLAALVAGCGDDGEDGSDGLPTATPSLAPFTPTLAPSTPTPQPSTPTAVPDTFTPIPPTPTPTIHEDPGATFLNPVDNQLSLAGPFFIRLAVTPPDLGSERLGILLDGVAVPLEESQVSSGELSVQVAELTAGAHLLQVAIDGSVHDQVEFEALTLNEADDCEILNNAECLLPYPSSRFLEPADTPTGWRLRFPEVGMPRQYGTPLSPEPYSVLDGFSPTVQILMHFPGNVDLAASAAPRLFAETRTTDTRSLDPDSPTILLDANTRERILHFLENDARAASAPERQLLFLRPGRSLTPGHRYIVAVRNLVHPDGAPVTPEPAFAALRDRRPTDIAALDQRAEAFEDIFGILAEEGVARENLVLAFDFHVQSDAGLTDQMLVMRNESFAWLESQLEAEVPTFTIDRVIENACENGSEPWRQVEGTYRVPLYLAADPVVDRGTPATLQVDEQGKPVQNGFTMPPFTITLPCSVLDPVQPLPAPIVIGHGLFGNGRSTVAGFAAGMGSAASQEPLNFILGGTDWWGLSSPDATPLAESFIVGGVVTNLDNFAALPDRLRQGQLNTLVLGRLMKSAAFNLDPAFRTPDGRGAFPGPQEEMYYLGGSLGGIMGLMFSALTPDITNTDIIVGSINFSILLQRATPFIQFDALLRLTGITDPIHVALSISVLHELWVRGESAGYATHITSDPFPGTNAKNVLMNVAWLDQQVSNVGSEITARTLGLPSLFPGSVMSNLPEIPDVPGPVAGALVVYDTGSFDLANPAHAPFIPPLANLAPTPNECDPHGFSSLSPAALRQLAGFFRPGGVLENFCNGACDAQEPLEIPYGAERPCDPTAP